MIIVEKGKSEDGTKWVTVSDDKMGLDFYTFVWPDYINIIADTEIKQPSQVDTCIRILKRSKKILQGGE